MFKSFETAHLVALEYSYRNSIKYQYQYLLCSNSSVTNITVYQCNISLSFPIISLFIAIPRKTSRGILTPYKIQTERSELPLNVEHHRFTFVTLQATRDKKESVDSEADRLDKTKLILLKH